MDGASLEVALVGVAAGVAVALAVVAVVWFARGWRFRLWKYRVRRWFGRRRHLIGVAPRSPVLRARGYLPHKRIRTERR